MWQIMVIDVKNVLLLLVLLLPVRGVLAEVLIVFGSDAFQPISYTADGQSRGIFPDILKRLEPLTKDRYQLTQVPWARAIRSAESGESGVANISWTAARAEIFDYSAPIYATEVLVVSRRDAKLRFETLEDLYGRRVGVGRGSSYREAFDTAVRLGRIQVEEDTEQSLRLRKLLGGRVDAILIGSGRLWLDTLVTRGILNAAEMSQLVIHGKPLIRDELHVAYPKTLGKAAALARMGPALAKLRASGAIAEIEQAYFVK